MIGVPHSVSKLLVNSRSWQQDSEGGADWGMAGKVREAFEPSHSLCVLSEISHGYILTVIKVSVPLTGKGKWEVSQQERERLSIISWQQPSLGSLCP